jgi:hypothetical protein
MLPEFPFEQEAVPIEPNSLLVAFSDGVTEAMNAQEELIPEGTDNGSLKSPTKIKTCPGRSRKRGAQPGNQNARRHGFYSRNLTPEEAQIFEELSGVRGLGRGIAILSNKINTMIAQRILFLIESLDSEMLSVTDLGDFKTVMSGGLRMGTMGFYQADRKNPSVRSAIQNSLKPSSLLYPANVYAGNKSTVIVGVVNHELACTMDLFSTCLKLAGTSVPVDRVIDGLDMAPLLSLTNLENLQLDWNPAVTNLTLVARA